MSTSAPRALLAAAAVALAAACGAARASEAGLPPAILHDPMNGAAIFGYDPVAFFSEGRARPGDRRFAASHMGLVWRFASEANRAAFAAHPGLYVPALGGHDALAAAEGAMAAGDPEHFLVVGNRLYFFRSAGRRGQAEADLDIVDRAEAGWARLSAAQRGQ
jgi:hypothetical protein